MHLRKAGPAPVHVGMQNQVDTLFVAERAENVPKSFVLINALAESLMHARRRRRVRVYVHKDLQMLAHLCGLLKHDLRVRPEAFNLSQDFVSLQPQSKQ